MDNIPDYQNLASTALAEAEVFWNTPECIPLLTSLFSNLLVTCAKMVFDVRKPGTQKEATKSRSVQEAEDNLDRAHKKRKREGRPKEKTIQLTSNTAKPGPICRI